MRTYGVLGLVLVAACAGAPKKPTEEDVWASPRRSAPRAARAARAPKPAQDDAPPAFDGSAWEASGASAAHDAHDATSGDDESASVSSAAKKPALASAASKSGAVPPAAPPEATPAPEPAPAAAPSRSGTADRKVQVSGLEGTLSSFDVRVTMDAKSREFGACHAPRLRRVPSLGGDVEFKIRVLADGTVEHVDLPSSSVGDRQLERCFMAVIKATAFPKPHGGDANVTYTMSLGVARKGREPEVWESERIRHIVNKHVSDVREMCELKSIRHFNATVYVNRRGKVIAAGVAGKSDEAAALDCIAEAVRKWPMPKAKKKAFAKVSFPMSGAG